MNKLVKERIIFQNYDLDGYEEQYKEMCEEDGEDFNEEAMWRWIDDMVNIDLEDALRELKGFFKNKVIAFGSIGLWNGVFDGGKVFNNFEKAFWDMTKDCDYIKIYDENGHLFVHCTHHDGSHTFEVKELTKKGEEYFERWEYSYDNRTERDCHKQLIAHYTTVPNFAHKIYGCKKREYVEPTKEEIQNKLNNEAKSFYTPKGQITTF